MKVYNMDVAGVIRRARRFRYETVKAVSSALASMSEADMLRAKSYLAAVSTYLDHVVSQPQLDLPESSPFEIDLGEPDALLLPENESLVDLLMMYDALEKEIGNSQSARQSTGVISHDEKRIRALVEKMGRFLDDYVASVLPLDLPESAPLRAMTGAGRTGI